MNESWLTMEKSDSLSILVKYRDTWMSHVTHMNESWLTMERAIRLASS